MPAPLWFVELFKVIGFILHLVPMGIWFAGLFVALGCAIWKCPCQQHSRRFAWRIFGQLPIFVALGINFGIVPLLFLQTAYYKSFYTATVLMAWHWFAIIPILLVGYYAIYLAAFSRYSENDIRLNTRVLVFAFIAFLGIVSIGLLISNGMTLMVRSDLWWGIMERTGVNGATTGLANNMRDPAMLWRVLTMFGLGFLTTSVWAVFDSHCLAARETHEDQSPCHDYRYWTVQLAALLSIIGTCILMATEVAIKSGLGGSPLQTAYPLFGYVVLLALLVSGLFNAAVWMPKIRSFILIAAGIGQVGTLATFAILRQIGQNAGVAPFQNVSEIPLDVQWTPLIAFLVMFIFGLAVILWMVLQLKTLEPKQVTATN
ncbi:MAG: hypothetical protein ACRCUY_01610 [Thermoguttaceae bacterium]